MEMTKKIVLIPSAGKWVVRNIREYRIIHLGMRTVGYTVDFHSVTLEAINQTDQLYSRLC